MSLLVPCGLAIFLKQLSDCFFKSDSVIFKSGIQCFGNGIHISLTNGQDGLKNRAAINQIIKQVNKQAAK